MLLLDLAQKSLASVSDIILVHEFLSVQFVNKVFVGFHIITVTVSSEAVCVANM